jgi:asparagine synthase (glutamine-hydrolysing)
VCGIAGIVQLDDQRVAHPTIDRFIGALAHRGPDAEAIVLEDNDRVALGHRRLAILDLTDAARQPMTSPSGRYIMSYNGEIYNFLELRHALERHGVQFRSEGDAEVILAAFERWGPDCLLRLNGMWSVAIWDRSERRMFLARDRFGVKPLYVSVTSRRLAFASELKAFLQLDGFKPVENTEAIRARLAGNANEGVLLHGVESLPPGHCLEVSRERARQWRWWNTLDHLVTVPPDLDEQAEQFRQLLYDSCALRLRADVPIASSLSGGLDSSSVVCTLAAVGQHGGIERRAPDWQRAYIAGFPATMQDEESRAMCAARRAGATASVHRFTGEELRDHLDGYLYQYEEIGGLYGIASWLLYGAMRRDGVFVSLDGHGGDELLGGYGLHVLLALIRGQRFTHAPLRAMNLIRTLQGMYDPRDPERPRSQATLAALTFPSIRAIARHLLASQRALAESLRRHSAEASPEEAEAIERLGPLTAVLYHSFHRESLPRILRNFDAYSMGHGVEVRMPFLDWNVVRYAFSVPDESKLSGGFAKRLLREAMRGVVPEALRLRRDKLGFTAPVADWLRGGLADWLWEELNDPDFLRSELWDGPTLLTLARTKRESGARWEPAEAHRVTLAITAHRWRTRWLGGTVTA